jgi:hypothetical protein
MKEDPAPVSCGGLFKKATNSTCIHLRFYATADPKTPERCRDEAMMDLTLAPRKLHGSCLTQLTSGTRGIYFFICEVRLANVDITIEDLHGIKQSQSAILDFIFYHVMDWLEKTEETD